MATEFYFPWRRVGPASESSLLTGLLAYWTMNEASGTVYDSTANNVDLTPYNSPTYSQTGILSSNCIRFNNTNAGLYNVTESLLNPTGDVYSVSSWIYLVTLPSVALRDMTIYRGLAGTPIWNNIHIYVDQTDLFNFVIFDSTNTDFGIQYTGALSTSTWYHFVCVAKGNGLTCRVFRNGTPQNGSVSQSGNLAVSNSEYNIGNSYNGGGAQFDGRIEEVGIWNKAVSDTEAATLYNGGTGITYPFS